MDSDLANYRVHGPVPIGWDPATLPNEVVDNDGTPLR